MIKRTHIRHFLALADCGSFGAAAERLHLTQPTLSSSIAELERMTGGPLFLRERRAVRLTEAGGRFLPLARELERGFRAADAFGAARPREWPTLRLGLIRTVAEPVLVALLDVLGRDGGLELIEGTDYELRAALASGRLDMALTLLRAGEAQARGSSIIPLVTEPYTMFVAETHPLAGSGPVAPTALAGEIMIARRRCEVLDETSRFFTSHGVRPRFALRSDSDTRCLAAVVAGLGMTTAPLSLGRAGVVPLDVTGYTFTRQLALIASPDVGPTAGVDPALLARAAAAAISAWPRVDQPAG